MEIDRKNTLTDVPKEWQQLHDSLYATVKSAASGKTWDMRRDATTIRIIMQSSMEIVDKFRKANGAEYSGSEKKQIVIKIVTWVLDDLATDNIVPRDIADNVIFSIEMLGGPMLDLAVSGAKGIIDIAQTQIAKARAAQTQGAGADDGIAVQSRFCC